MSGSVCVYMQPGLIEEQIAGDRSHCVPSCRPPEISQQSPSPCSPLPWAPTCLDPSASPSHHFSPSDTQTEQPVLGEFSYLSITHYTGDEGHCLCVRVFGPVGMRVG